MSRQIVKFVNQCKILFLIPLCIPVFLFGIVGSQHNNHHIRGLRLYHVQIPHVAVAFPGKILQGCSSHAVIENEVSRAKPDSKLRRIRLRQPFLILQTAAVCDTVPNTVYDLCFFVFLFPDALCVCQNNCCRQEKCQQYRAHTPNPAVNFLIHTLIPFHFFSTIIPPLRHFLHIKSSPDAHTFSEI